MKKINQILNNQIDLISPGKEVDKKLNQISKIFIKDLNKKLKQKKISAEVFIGGSLAKHTLIKKNKYDIDVFVRFNTKYKDKEITKLLGKVMPKDARKVHGSRDYYQISFGSVIMEVIPVLRINKPQDAVNITDLSYFHVNYLLKKIKKNKRLANEIKLAKAFCYAQDCYGAESYIHGFSGYGLELLISHYSNFEKFLKEIVKLKERKLVIDDSKFYKNKDVLKELNESKLHSPIVLIDPTFKERNALASLNKTTFDKFINAIRRFLKKPSDDFFVKKDIKKELVKKYKNKLITLTVKTTKQAGDIAGTKSKKFLDFFLYKLKREFTIKISEFDYDEKKNIAYFYLVLDKKRDEVIRGPNITNVNNFKRFKKANKSAFVRGNFIYAKLKHNMKFNKWFELFKVKEKKIIKDMNIKKIF